MENGKDNRRVSWSELLHTAVNQPGVIHEAYTRFWNYSFGNQILALMQCKARNIEPGPIATFPHWKELGRHVRKGEKALTLCMPVTVKCRNTSESSDSESESAADPDNPGVRTVFVFRPHWFALSQTDGEPYSPAPIPDWDRTAALAALGIQEEPFTMTDGNCQGYATRDRKIAISPIAALPHKTFFHEAAHVVLGHVAEGSLSDGETIPKSLREVEAESVALICCESLGLDGADFARGYIQHWLHGEEIPEKSAQRILHGADSILKSGK